MEIVDRHDTNTYRAVYTVQFAGRIYVLHAFQKKSKMGIRTPQKDIELIRQRPPPSATTGKVEPAMKRRDKRIGAAEESGNVFADLKLPHAEQELLKARLTLQIYKLIKARGLTQAKAGEILGIKQPHVSALMRNRAGVFSVERLMEFLTDLGQDVEITVRPTRKEHGKVSVVVAA
jgi:predicted XRE-type DNA-binding protein